MKIVEKYSHLNGYEFLLVHKSNLWNELENVINSIDAEKCKTKISKEKTKKGQLLYSPKDMNDMFKQKLSVLGWTMFKMNLDIPMTKKFFVKIMKKILLYLLKIFWV